MSTLVSASEGILYLGLTLKTEVVLFALFIEGGNIYFEPEINGITSMPFGHFSFGQEMFTLSKFFLLPFSFEMELKPVF